MHREDGILIAKTAARWTTALAIGHVVGAAISMNVPARNNAEKVLVVVGKITLSSMLGDLAVKHVDQKIDDAIHWYDDTFSTNKGR